MRRNSELSASALHRVSLCAASACLPHVREVTTYGTRGTAIHKYLESIARGASPEAALTAVASEHRTICEAIELDSVPACDPATYRSEVALAWDVETGWARELGESLGRDYSNIDPTEIPGTADVLALSDDAVFVADYKTGFRPVPRAAENLQLRFLALAACRAHERERAVVAIIRLREDGSAWYDQAELGPVDLDDTEREVRELVANVERVSEQVFAGEIPSVTTGDHCSYCPAKAHCPAYAGLVARLAADPAQVVDEIRAALTPEQAAEAYRHLRRAEEALGLAKTALQFFARAQPIDLGDGTVYGEVETTKTTLDPAKAYQLIAQLHGEETALAAVEPSVSQASIKRALEAHRDAKPSVKVQAALDDILAKLRAAGGVTEKPGKALKEHRVRPALLAAGGAR